MSNWKVVASDATSETRYYLGDLAIVADWDGGSLDWSAGIATPGTPVSAGGVTRIYAHRAITMTSIADMIRPWSALSEWELWGDGRRVLEVEPIDDVEADPDEVWVRASSWEVVREVDPSVLTALVAELNDQFTTFVSDYLVTHKQAVLRLESAVLNKVPGFWDGTKQVDGPSGTLSNKLNLRGTPLAGFANGLDVEAIWVAVDV